jgi:hypothetical protein
MKKNTVTQEQVDEILNSSKKWVQTIWNKTTMVAVHLPNGFVIVESSSCVDPNNYDVKLGEQICLDRIKNKIWELSGYALQDLIHQDSKRGL